MNFLQYNSYRLWDIQDKFFMFDILNLINVEIDEKLYNSLKKEQWNELDVETIGYLKKLHDKNLFFYDIKHVEFSENIEEKEVSFSLTPVLECNLNCKYCFANAGKNYTGKERKYNRYILKKIADYLIGIYPNVQKYHLSFVSGGEPFLDKNGLFDMIDFLNSFFSQKGKIFTMWLCTNGTLVEVDDLKLLDRYNMQIGISQDGIQKIHDKCRVDKNGNGTYDLIVQKINNILSSEELSDRMRKIWGSAVITSESCGFLSVLLEHKRVGIANSQLRFIQSSKHESLSIKGEHISKVYSWIDELIAFVKDEILSKKLEIPLMILNENDYVGKIIRRLIIQKPYIKRCHAGKLHFAFTPEGDIYPCDSFLGNDKFKLGNVFDGEHSTFTNYSVLERDECNGCWIRFVCGGDCYYNSFSCNQDIRKPDKIFCKIMHYAVKRSLWMIHEIQIDDLETYLELKRILNLKDTVNYNVK